MSGAVTEYLFQMIAKQVEDRGVVVWYDPERCYEQAVTELSIAETTIARYKDSFFSLRHAIDHLLNNGEPPRLVVYVPMSQAETHDALIELEAAGVVMRPGQQPLNRNTKLSRPALKIGLASGGRQPPDSRGIPIYQGADAPRSPAYFLMPVYLAVVARNALRPILGEDRIAQIEKQVETAKLSLADLNALAEKGKDIAAGVLALIFGTANPQDVALAILHDERHDSEIERKSALGEVRNLLQVSFDVEFPAATTLANVRERLARHVLLTELLAALGEHVPSTLGSVKVATSSGGVDSCMRLAQSWRNNRSFRDSYVNAANRVEQEFSLSQLAFNPQCIAANETFLAVERAMLRHVENQLLEASNADLLRLAVARLFRFWAEVEPAVQARWALIATAAEVLLEADRVAKEIKNPPTTVLSLLRAYAEGEEPWCLLDTHHRHLESRKYNFDFDASGEHQGLEKLIAKAEHRYTEVGSALAKHFVSTFQKAKHPIKGLLRQRDFFETYVRPRLGAGKVAYLWVDALRFEMARELCRLLKDDFELALQPALGTIPTITEIGMAALLPKAHESLKVVALGSGKLAVEIDRTVIKDRKDRVAFLKKNAAVTVFDCRLDDLLPKPNKTIRDGIQAAELVLVTSQEIDELCEADNIAQARLQMDGVLGQLRRGVRILSDHGIKTIILAADHGHLFADEIGDDMKIEAPGGKA